MTFEQFQATRRTVSDLSDAIEDEQLVGAPGLVYLDALFIELRFEDWVGSYANDYAYKLLIGRDDWCSNELEPLERKLYEFAVSEGYCD
jgi:hypothetical protein